MATKAVQRSDTSIRLRDDLLARTDRLAEALERSRASVIEEALERYLEEEEQELEILRQRIAQADAGDVVDGDEVLKWIESWASGSKLPKPG